MATPAHPEQEKKSVPDRSTRKQTEEVQRHGASEVNAHPRNWRKFGTAFIIVALIARTFILGSRRRRSNATSSPQRVTGVVGALCGQAIDCLDCVTRERRGVYQINYGAFKNQTEHVVAEFGSVTGLVVDLSFERAFDAKDLWGLYILSDGKFAAGLHFYIWSPLATERDGKLNAYWMKFNFTTPRSREEYVERVRSMTDESKLDLSNVFLLDHEKGVHSALLNFSFCLDEEIYEFTIDRVDTVFRICHHDRTTLERSFFFLYNSVDTELQLTTEVILNADLIC